jgi:outer membrane autotransporter protein
LAGAAFGFSGSAMAAQVDSGTISCTGDGFPTSDSGNANTTSTDDFVTITVNDLTPGSVVTFNVTTDSAAASVRIDDDGAVAGTYSPNSQILNNGSGFQSVFTATGSGTAVFTLDKQAAAGTWLTWSASCAGAEPPGEFALAITKSETSTGPYNLGDTIEFEVQATNIGSAGLENVTIVDPDADLGTCSPANGSDLPDTNDTLTCPATHEVTQADLNAGFYENCATADSDETDPVEACATVFFIQTPAAEKADEATRAYLFRRMDRLLADGPDRARLLRKRADRGYPNSPVDFTGSGGSGSGMNVTFGTSLQQVLAYNAGDTARKLERSNGRTTYSDIAAARRLSSGGSGADLPVPVYEEVAPAYTPPPASRFDVWIEGHYTNYDSDSGDGDFGVVYVGADWLFNENWLIGLLAQFDGMSQTQDSDSDISDIDGRGWMVGPYISGEVVKNIFFDARVAWGQSDNDVTVDVLGVPFSGDFDTDRWLAQAALTGNWSRGNWRVTPLAKVGYIEEKRKTFDVDDGMGATATVDGTTLSLGRLTVGPEFAYRFFRGSWTIEPQLGTYLLWDFHTEGDEAISGMTVYDAGARGAVELGLGLQAANGVAARIAVKYDGIGSGDDLNAWNINGWLNFRF